MGAYYDDRFEISRKQLADYEDIATCPSCSLIIRVIYDPLDFEDEPPDDESESEGSQKEESDEDSDGDKFEDAFDKITLQDAKPATVAVSA